MNEAVEHAIGLVTAMLPESDRAPLPRRGVDMDAAFVQQLLAALTLIAREIAREGAQRAGCTPDELVQAVALRLQGIDPL